MVRMTCQDGGYFCFKLILAVENEISDPIFLFYKLFSFGILSLLILKRILLKRRCCHRNCSCVTCKNVFFVFQAGNIFPKNTNQNRKFSLV